MKKLLTLVVLWIVGMPMLAGCGLLVPLVITAAETAAPIVIEDVAAAAIRHEEAKQSPDPASPASENP